MPKSLLRLPDRGECVKHIERASRLDPRLVRLLDALAAGKYTADDGRTIRVQPSGITKQIGGLIHWLVTNRQPSVTLDMGAGSGIGASFMALAKSVSGSPTHFSFYPGMGNDGAGRSLLAHLGLDAAVSVSTDHPHIGLQRLGPNVPRGSIGLALIDGPCLFDLLIADHVVLDQFLRSDGLLLVCQAGMPQIRALLSFLKTNRRFEVRRWAHEFAVVGRGVDFQRSNNYFMPFEVPLEGQVEAVDGVVVETTAPDGDSFQFANEPSHQYYLRRVLHGQEYPALSRDLFLPRLILDVGAHVGSAARYFTALYPTARIVCVEPTPESYELLCRNTAHLPNVERHRIAFAGTTGALRIWRGISSSGQNSAMPNEENVDSSFEVEGVEPLAFCAREGIDAISIMKIDIEGMELSVLRNLEPMIDRIEVFYIEYHSEELRRQIEDLLRPKFTLFMSNATDVNRGTVGYVNSGLLKDLEERSLEPRYVFPKVEPVS